VAKPRADTTLDTTKSRGVVGAGASLHALAYIGCVDTPSQDHARLVCLGDSRIVRIGRGESFAVRRAGPELHVKLADVRVSRVHASVVIGPQSLVIDEGARNGTFVNGNRVVDQHLLRPGDVLETGHGFWRFIEFTPDDSAWLDEPSAVVGPTRTICPTLVSQMRLLERVVESRLPVVVLGETGTGKEVVARQIHERSGRSGRFQAINCAAIPPTLLESTLFGHRRGAFTGATEDRAGVIEEAHQGTLLLDEVGDLPADAQAKLLRVLQEGEIVRIGEARPRRVDVRVAVATHRDLPEQVRAGRFREDLYGRLAGFTLRLPPLRERLEDIGILLAHLVDRFARDKAPRVQIEVELMRWLLRHSWPFNVRELERVTESALLLAAGEAKLRVQHFEPALAEARRAARPRGPAPQRRLRDDELRGHLETLLREHDGNISAVARAMGKSRTQIHRWMRSLRLQARPAQQGAR